jgi:hypothetical protein
LQELPVIEERCPDANSAERSQGLAAQPRMACTMQLWKAALSGSGEVAAISPAILTGAQSETSHIVAREGNRPDNICRRLRPCRMRPCRTFCLTLTLTDSALRNRPGRHPGMPAAEPELPEERCKSRYVAEPKAVARPKAVVESRRAAQAKAIS